MMPSFHSAPLRDEIMTTSNSRLHKIQRELKRYLNLDFQDYGLEELPSGEFQSKYIGIRMNSSFQPIYHQEEGDIFGYEAILKAFLGDELTATPDFAFDYADKAGKLISFDRSTRALHVLNFKQIYADQGLLFLSVHPNLLISVNEHGKTFEQILHAYSVPTHQVVIQIDEGLIAQDRLLTEAINNYRERGYLIAITNFGSKNSHINRLWQYNPNFVKFSPSLIDLAEENVSAKRVLRGLIKTVQDIDALPIVTDIKRQSQLDIAVESGASLIQGAFLSEAVSAQDLQTILSIRQKKQDSA
jgi:EAL domain-containing protein (putative c-di-GMP-specific phosphodiesterase class I)